VTRHAREVLEFPAVLTLLGERAGSRLAREWLQGLEPLPLPDARRELDRVRATMELVQDDPTWFVPAAPEAESSLYRLQVEGGVLEPRDLVPVHTLLTAGRQVAEDLDGRPDLDSHLSLCRGRIWVAPEIESTLAKTVDEDGQVLDSASKDLARIRGRLRGAHRRIVAALERLLDGLPERIRVPDASVSVREGRYVIPVRREGRKQVGGIVHDESDTGSTLFVEPPLGVERMNELRDLQREEKREIQRVLRELSARLRPFEPDLRSTLMALVDLDTLHVRARAALAWRATPPGLADDAHSGLKIVDGRHPLLLEAGGDVVPFALEMEAHERTLLISGPNTGGKSVLLKAIGLLTLLARSGVVPPVGKGTVLPGVSSVYADIGDQQSISESLSTFSAHLATAMRILEKADADSLILMDELGTGTDPAEGAALARAVLETLTARGCLTLATSHLGTLKTLDAPGNGFVNASMQFDSDEMAPTYRLVKGRPGRSYGLAIARGLGFPPEVLARAEVLVEDGSARLEHVLEGLEAREREARERAARLERSEGRVAALEEELRRREATLVERERSSEERIRQQARDILMHARSEVETAIRTVREVAAAPEELSEAARAARKKVEAAADRQRRRKPSRLGSDVGPDEKPESGDRVRVGQGRTSGTVEEVRDEKAIVLVSGLRMEVPLREVTLLQRGDASDSGAPAGGESGGPPLRRERGWTESVPEGRYEIDLRGLRVDEVELELGRSLDGALLSDLHEVRIIHGKGTGAVKGRVQELLKRDRRIDSFRGGRPGEGGGGVTVAVFR
jgi:DNA mismatch repair protein MutS2